MNIIKVILKKIAKIIHFIPATEEEKIEYARRQRAFYSLHKSNETIINPVTGLPMVGCLDINGNSFGVSSSSDHYIRSNENSYPSSIPTSYSSNYDPFTNRYQ